LHCRCGLEEVVVNDVAVDDVAVNTVGVDDVKLLREYVRTGSQKAFAEIVKLHMGTVYATCLREVRDANLAEDAAQSVFLTLSRKARTVLSYRSLSGWLFLAARLEGRSALRRELRRSRAEERHATLVSAQMTDGPDWFRHERVVNDALSALNTTDREAVLLRYFEGRTAREVADVLGVSETAAERRLSRAVLKMREHLTAYGVASTVALLALLDAERAQAVPAKAITNTLQRHAAAHGTAGAGAYAGAAVLKGLRLRQATAAGAALLLAAGVIAVIHYRSALPSIPGNLIQRMMIPDGAKPVVSNFDIGAPLQTHTAAMRTMIASPHAAIRNGILTLTAPSTSYEMPSIYSPQPFEGNVVSSPAFTEHPSAVVAVPDPIPSSPGMPAAGIHSAKTIWTGDISKKPAVFMVDETYRGTALKDESGKTLWQSSLLPQWIRPISGGMTAAVETYQEHGVKQARLDSQQRLKALEKQYAGRPGKAAEYSAKRDAIVQETRSMLSDAVERARGALYAYQQGHLIMKITVRVDHGTVEIRTPDDHLQLVTTADIVTLQYDTLKGGTRQSITIEPSAVRPRTEIIGPILPQITAGLTNGERRLIFRSHTGAFVVQEIMTARNGVVNRSFMDIFGQPAIGLIKSDTPGGSQSPFRNLLPSSLRH